MAQCGLTLQIDLTLTDAGLSYWYKQYLASVRWTRLISAQASRVAGGRPVKTPALNRKAQEDWACRRPGSTGAQYAGSAWVSPPMPQWKELVYRVGEHALGAQSAVLGVTPANQHQGEEIVRKTRRLGTVLAVLALSAIAVSPALAATINPNQVPVTPAEWTAANPETSAEECTGDNVPGAGEAKWHFILNGATSGQTVTLTATFTDATGATVVMTDVGDEASTSGTYHFYITTPDDYTLENATTDETGTSNELVLSHVCLGTPPVVVPEAPASALLVLSAGVIGILFLLRRRPMVGKVSAA